jgi:hypothetical protein
VKYRERDDDLATIMNYGDTVDLVLNGFEIFGQADRETEPREADRQTILVSSGQGEPPLQIEACRTAGGWARGVSAQIVQEMALADGLFPAVERAG